MKRQRELIVVSIFIMVNSLLQACGGTGANFGNTTRTPSPVMPTIAMRNFTTPCPPVSPYVYHKGSKPRVIYALIDRSGSYGQYTDQAVKLLIESLRASIKFGDKLHIIWLGESETPDDYLLVETVPTYPFPVLETALPTLTPEPPVILQTNTPKSEQTPRTQLQAQSISQTETAEAIANMQTATAESIRATNVAVFTANDLNSHSCKQTASNVRNQNAVNDWQIIQENTVNDFINSVLLPLREQTFSGRDKGTHIYNALFYAAKTIRQERATGQFGAYYLIIFSDMDDIGSRDGQLLDIDLSNVNVLFPMLYCIQAIDCQNRQSQWETYFQEHGAVLPPEAFWTVRETTPDLIVDFLGGMK